jgi:ABC-type branched-subunit amino acid transport system ATPase component
MTAALETKALCKSFGALDVARNIDFALAKGERRALIGPNGAGKTTFINLITGAIPPSSGQVLLDGADVTRLAQAERVKRGLARTFQINQLFRGLSVRENVCMPISERVGARKSMLRPMGARGDVIAEANEIIAMLGLEADAERLVRELPYGRQRLVEIAIALGLKPSVLLLDEPTAGVPEGEGGVLIDVIEKLPADISVLIIEHDMDVVFRFAQRITVLVAGEILTEGPPAEIAADPRVRAVYLGEGVHG